MQNPGAYRPPENYEEEKMFNDNFASVIDSDFLITYLNDPEATQRRAMQAPNLFNQFIPEMQMSFPNFQEAPKGAEHFQGIYGKKNMQDSWLMGGVNESSKISYAAPAALNYKLENAEEFDGNAKVKKLKNNKEQEVQKTPDNAAKMKSNIKNTYINKINSLVHDKSLGKADVAKGNKHDVLKLEAKRTTSSIKNETDSDSANKSAGIKKVRSCDVLKSDELEKLNIKLEKNRESARNSRIRKKVYIDLLEKTVDQLQQELGATRKQLEANSLSLCKINFQSKPINNLYTAKQQLFERLEKMVSSKAEDSEISFLIDSLRLRFGATGKERVEVVNSMFRQIMDFLVPVHMKYLLSIASQGKDVFNVTENGQTAFSSTNNQSENTEYWNELVAQVNLTETQRKQMMRYRKKLLTEKQKFEGIVHNLNQVRKSVIKQASSLQGVVDDFRSYLSPTQTAKLLLTLEKEKNRKEFSAEKLWSTVAMKKESQGEEDSDSSDNFLEELDADPQSGLNNDIQNQKLLEIVPSMDYLDNGK